MKHAPLSSRPRNRTGPTGRRARTAALLVGATTLTLLLAACSSGSEEESSPSTGSNEPAPSDTAEVTPSETSSTAQSGATAITITAGDQTFKARLNNSKVAQDFAQMLPVTLPWFRNADIEYITELDAPLTETGPFYTDVQPGDLVYYNPLDSITIIYEETSSVPTLTKMGEITSSDLDAFEDLPENVDMRITAG